MPPRVRAIPKSVAAYYRKVPKTHRKVILEMRSRILEIVPNSQEVMSYGMPAFRVDGNIVAGLLANKNHIGFYPFSGSVVGLFKRELREFKRTKSAIHIPLDTPLSKTLIRKLIRARISQCPVKQGKVDLDKYAKLDSYWRSIGLAAPACRGLVDNKILKLKDLGKTTRENLRRIHGVGPNALKIIEREMKKHPVRFKIS